MKGAGCDHPFGIDEIRADVLPEDKARLQEAGHRVALAGDAVNETPALAQTDLGIASAGLAVMNGNLDSIVDTRRLWRAMVGNIRCCWYIGLLSFLAVSRRRYPRGTTLDPDAAIDLRVWLWTYPACDCSGCRSQSWRVSVSTGNHQFTGCDLRRGRTAPYSQRFG